MPEQSATPPPAPAKPANVALQVLGSIFMVVAVLLMLLSGICTGVVMFSNTSSADAFFGMLPMALTFGGIPIAAGIGLFFAGRAMYRSGAAKP